MTKTNQKLNDYIEENREELLGILRRLCAVPSVAGEKTGENAPYGEGCRRVDLKRTTTRATPCTRRRGRATN